MKIEILLATMFFENEKDEFLKNMNIKTDIIIGNQSNYNENIIREFNGQKVTILSRNERGVGKNRNVSLFASDADIVIFADNDVTYFDNYADDIRRFYDSHQEADVVIFNFKEKRGETDFYDINTKDKRAKLYDLTKFGTWAVTARRKSIIKERISFSLLFGGGAKYSAGEDSLFLLDCYQHGLKIYLCSKTIGYVEHRESTWFRGINEKLLHDRGALYAAVHPELYRGIILFHAIKHRKMYKAIGGITKTVKMMINGANEYKSTV